MSNRGVRLLIQQLCPPHGERLVEVEHDAGNIRPKLTEAQLRHAGAADDLGSLPRTPAYRRQVDHHAVGIGEGKNTELHRLREIYDQPGHVGVLADPNVRNRGHGLRANERGLQPAMM